MPYVTGYTTYNGDLFFDPFCLPSPLKLLRFNEILMTKQASPNLEISQNAMNI